MKFLFSSLLILFCSAMAHADHFRLNSIYEEKENLYQGYDTALTFFKEYKEGWLQQWNVGLNILSGTYLNGVTLENKTFTSGIFARFENSYADFSAQVSENDNLRPFSKLSYMHFIPTGSNEFGIGYEYATYSAFPNSKVVMLTVAHLMADDYVSATVYADTEQSDLVAYMASLRKILSEKWDTRFYAAAGKRQQDFGFSQYFTSASAVAVYKINETSKLRGIVAKSWGDLENNTEIGLAYSWYY